MTTPSLLPLWIIILIFKLALAAALPLVPDEAYYWVWSHNLSLSYFDHPPMVAWWLWLGQWGEDWGGLVRWPAILLVHMTAWIWLKIFSAHLDHRQQVLWLILWALTPLTGPGSIIVTPDLPLLFFWSASLLAFIHWQRSPSRTRAIGLGALVGLGLISKYIMVLIFPVFALSLFFRRPLSRMLLWQHLSLFVLGTVLFSLPLWLWNWQNDFTSLKFQLSHGLGRTNWKPTWTMEYVLAQIGLLFPLIFFWALRARGPLLWHLAAWIPLGFFLLTSFRGYAEVNWPIVAHPTVLALALHATKASTKKILWIAGFWLFAFCLALSHVVFDWPLPSKEKIKSRELGLYSDVARAVTGLRPLYARSYQMAASLSFQLKRPVYKLAGMNRKDFYDFLPDSSPHLDRYYLVREPGESLPQRWVSAGHVVLRKIIDVSNLEVVEVGVK